MILLDTNVISAVMRDPPDPTAVRWLDAQPSESLWTTAVTVLEVAFGLGLIADARRRRRLEQAFAAALDDPIDGRVLAFDRAAAEAAAEIAVAQRKRGRPVEIRDVQIAGIARARRATLATRNTRHFAGLGIALVDPWSS